MGSDVRPTIAFLGAGRMASAMIRGILARGLRQPGELVCASKSGDSARRLAAETGIGCRADLTELLQEASAVVVAFKPQQLASSDPRLAELTRAKLVISLLAGKRLDRLSATFPHARNLVRAMPNTPGQIGAGVTGFCADRPLEPADQALVLDLLGALGQVVSVTEAEMDAVTAVSGSGPAYVFEFIAALREGGIGAGLSREIAQTLALETVLGAARLAARSELSPEELRDQVTSPNGTTMAGLRQLEKLGLRQAIQEAVLAAQRRSEELSQEP